MRQIPILLLLAAAAACRPEPAETGRARVAAAADAEPAPPTGMEYEAPRLIPAMRAHLEVLRAAGAGATEGNLAGYRAKAGDLVHAMITDLDRFESSEVDGIRMLGDTVVNLAGGGTGGADASPEDLERSAALMRRLIDRYQDAMRAARN